MITPFPILLIDDDPNIADVLIKAAKHTFPEAQIKAIHSFAEAIHYLEEPNDYVPQLVLLDVDLGASRSGLDFLEIWQQQPMGQYIPLIILSAEIIPIHQKEALNLGMNAYTRKPISYEGWKEFLELQRTLWLDTDLLSE